MTTETISCETEVERLRRKVAAAEQELKTYRERLEHQLELADRVHRSLLPKRVDNLLAAGRCGSADFLGHAAGKSMGNMMALGQAAGVAAALCAAQGVTPRALSVPQLQAALRAMGARL